MLTPEQIAKLTTPKPGPMTSRLPKKFAGVNAKLAASVERRGVRA